MKSINSSIKNHRRKTARHWGNEDEKVPGADKNGYPTKTNETTFILAEMPKDFHSLSGIYLLKYQGEGIIKVYGDPVKSVAHDTLKKEIRFAYEPGPDLVAIRIENTDRYQTGNHIRNINVIKEEHLALWEAGEIFNPECLKLLEGFRMIRFMNWAATNTTSLSKWHDRPQYNDCTWGNKYLGVPLEVQVALANRIGADPWFNLPHLATNEFIENMVRR